MATSERFMPVPPEAVWDALADAGAYADWVVGSKRIRDAESAWPAPGSRLHHTVGFGPFAIDDDTRVLEAHPPALLRLRANARPLGSATVTLSMQPADGGTVVRLTEQPAGLAGILALNPLVHLLTRARNAQSLQRLERIALARATQ